MGGLVVFPNDSQSQGYYCDMVQGYISRVGGAPRMVYYPKELQSIQTFCPYCHESSGLNVPQMNLLIKEWRDHFQSHIDEIISTRIANGERYPYPNNKNVDRKSSLSSVTKRFNRYVKRNLVTPSKHPKKCNSRDDNDTQGKDEFYFAVDANKLVICQCMVAHANEIEVEVPEEDNESSGEDVVTVVRYQKRKVAGDDASHTENESEESIDPSSDQDEMELQRVHSA